MLKYTVLAISPPTGKICVNYTNTRTPAARSRQISRNQKQKQSVCFADENIFAFVIYLNLKLLNIYTKHPVPTCEWITWVRFKTDGTRTFGYAWVYSIAISTLQLCYADTKKKLKK